ncbi:hypothetical protein [Kitasatospora sp. NPDC057198]|uniref:hypothetical protein n=1 Tax=Kitasatospora sp. NPDC057198 TaxID=3346046 RepID=UPI00362F92DB
MTDTQPNGPVNPEAKKHPHAPYAQAVLVALRAVRADPTHVHVSSYMAPGVFYAFEPCVPEPMPDGHLPLVATADAWLGHGVELRWDADQAWVYTPLHYDREPAWDQCGYTPLPLPMLAHPDDVAVAALLLLVGRTDFTPSTREWEHAPSQANALREYAEASNLWRPWPHNAAAAKFWTGQPLSNPSD